MAARAPPSGGAAAWPLPLRGLLLRGGVNAGGDGVHSPRRTVDGPLTKVARPGRSHSLWGGGAKAAPAGRALRNTHPSGGRPTAGGCDAGAHSGLVRRVRAAAIRRSPPPSRPPASFRGAGPVPPCPGAGNARGSRDDRRCRISHQSRSSRRSRLSQSSLVRVSF